MKYWFCLLVPALLCLSGYAQENVTAFEFPIKIVSADVIYKDTAFAVHNVGTRSMTRHYNRGVFDHFVYKVKVCFMLEMGKEWDEPFIVSADSPDGKVERFVLNKEKARLPDYNFFYFNIPVGSKISGFARLKVFAINEADDSFFCNRLYTSFYLP